MVNTAKLIDTVHPVNPVSRDNSLNPEVTANPINNTVNGKNSVNNLNKAIIKSTSKPSRKQKRWYDYLWIVSALYLALGFFNILFAWFGLVCFLVPLIIATFKGSKAYCNRYCGRGQLFELLGSKLGLSRKRDIPAWLRSKGFRYGFLAFFMIMFFNMIFSTWLVFSGVRELKEVITLLWVFKVPWHWAGNLSASSWISPWVAQFAFGFYSVMLTSTVLGLVTMLLYKPRSWCVYCPMGTMTQGICMIKWRSNGDKDKFSK